MSDWKPYFDALRDGDVRRALSVVDKQRASGSDLFSIYVDVIQPAMREVGRLWQENVMTVADEHMATAITQTVMAHVFTHDVAGLARSDRPSIVAACTDTERHEIGLRMLCDVLEAEGWTAHYLGATVPTEDLVAMLRARQPDILALSVTINPHLPRLRNIIQTVRNELGDETPHITVGGRPFLENPEMAKRVGADSTAKDVREAAAMLKNVVAMKRQAG